MADQAIQAVFAQAVREGWWGKYQAGQCERLEAWLAAYHNVSHVHLCGSGNYGIELALRALQIGAGDEVLLADYDYPGNFFSIHAVGALPVLVDVEPRCWCLSLDAVREAIGPKTKAILASHLHGGRLPMRELMELARERGLAVIEDAAQAAGALVLGRRAGSWGDVAVLSFGGSKLLSAGRGGALLTSRADVSHRARNHLMRAGNIVCPLSELQAALLLPQCEPLDERNLQRWRNVQLLSELLANVPGVRLFVDANAEALPAFYKLGVQFDAVAFGLSRTPLIRALRAEGFAVDEGFAVAHHQRSPKRYRQGSALSEAERANVGCVQIHHPILLGSAEEMRLFSEAWRRIQVHAKAIAEMVC